MGIVNVQLPFISMSTCKIIFDVHAVVTG